MNHLIEVDGHTIRADDVSAVTRIEYATKKSFLNDTCRVTTSFTILFVNGDPLIIQRTETIPVDDEGVVDLETSARPMMNTLEEIRAKFIAEIGERRRTSKAQ